MRSKNWIELFEYEIFCAIFSSSTDPTLFELAD